MQDSLVRQEASAAKFGRGWYLISWSADLGPGEVKPLRYFGKNYVLYRGEDGQAVLLDAHCPHLGAHLGYGGRVEGNDIVCPFHAWRFGASGRCTAVPYASRIPPRAAIRTYPLREHSGLILGYFGPKDREPDYEVPAIEELDDPAWTPLERAHIEIATHPREVIENVADLAHFIPVHNTRIDDFKVIIDGPRATQHSVGRGRNLKGEKIPVVSVATYHGPAIQFTRLAWAYDFDSQECATRCHARGGSDPVVAWDQELDIDCNSCHQNPPAGHLEIACNLCHRGINPAGTELSRDAPHLNGRIDAFLF